MFPIDIDFSRLKEVLTYDPQAPMIFSSGIFLWLFAAFMVVYVLLQRKYTARILFVTLFSYYFYYKSSGTYFFLLAIVTVADFFLAQLMDRAEGYWKRKGLVVLSLSINLGLLVYFKYTNFIIGDVVNEMFSTNFSLQSIALPVGISFYTFQAISYAVDTYKRKFDMEVTLLEYCFYLTFFPLLMAGPITRAANLIPRLKRNEQASSRMLWTGLFLIMLGLVKKNMLSDYIAQFNNWVFDAPQTFSGFENLAALFGYPVQIFLDFSGYSDMSIGVAAILGFYLPDNFYFPYRSLSVTEFWHRWHISLSFWFRDYVYIPLGGNRKGKVRMYFNNFLTMLVAGLWHGSSWMFVIWGALHGFGLVVHKFFSRQLGISFPRTLAGNSLSWLITYLYICFAWSFFRAKDLGVLGKMWDKVANDFSIDYLVPFFHARPAWTLCIIGVMLSYLFTERQYHRLQARFILLPWVTKLLLFIICLQMVVEVSQESVQPFIYYQF